MNKLLFAFFCCCAFTSFSQNLPNSSFEDWTNSGTYDEPSGGFWTSLNTLSNLAAFAPVTVSKTTDSRSGLAAKLVSGTLGTFTIPGLLVSGTTGEFSLTDPASVLKQGQPFSSKPVSFSGYMKYQPVGADSGVVFLMLTKYNTSTAQQDTLAVATQTYNSAITEYTQFNLPLEYYDAVQTPDSITVSFISSGGAATFQGNPGSTLFIDDVVLDYTSSIAEPNSRSLSIKFDLFQNFWVVVNNTNQTKQVAAFDLVGRKLWKKSIEAGETLQISDLGLENKLVGF